MGHSTTTATTKLTLERYAPDTRALVAGAQTLADQSRHAEVLPLHLLEVLLERAPAAAEVLRAAGANLVELGASVARLLASVPTASSPAYLSSAMQDLLARAEKKAELNTGKRVELGQLVSALASEVRGPVAELLSAYGIGPGSLLPHLHLLSTAARGPLPLENSPMIADVTRDLVELARRGLLDPTLGRESETRRLLTILERRTKCHPLLVGESGVGRRALIHALARRVAQGDVPTSLVGARVLELDLGQLSAGARSRSDAEDRTRRLLVSLAELSGDVILVLRGLEQVLPAGPIAGGVGDALRTALGRGSLRLCGTTTPDGRRRILEKDAELFRWFTVIELEEPSIPVAIEILRGVAGRYEAHHQVNVEEAALVAAVRLAKRYLQDRFLPESALDLLDEAMAERRVETDGVSADDDMKIQRVEALRAQIDSLSQAEDELSRRVRTELEGELTAVHPVVEELRARKEARRGGMAALRALRAELAHHERELGEAERTKDYAKIGELSHAILPALRARLEKAETALGSTEENTKLPQLRAQHVAQTLGVWTGIPVAKMLEAETDKLLNMEERLELRVVGQSEGVRAIAKAVRRGRVGLRDQKRPIGSFLFLGPSGVGKTELAKALAEFLFDDEQSLTRLDMSEFMERHMAQRLVGAPPGYADSEQGGFLTEAVRRRPYSVLLFDEVEKAHADVFNLLLQVLDDGRLTDGRGRLADFSNTVVVMTSNIGSSKILEAPAATFESREGIEALRDELLVELRQFFRPEMLNRIDEVVVFQPLSRTVLRRIAELQVASLGRMLRERELTVELGEGVLERLVELGYEPALGARPLRRVIARELQDPLADAILRGKTGKDGKITITLDESGQFCFGRQV